MIGLKNTKYASLFLVSILILSVFLSFGCSSDREGGTLNEPEITVEYLEGEYTEQLLRDGAEQILGTVTVSSGSEDKQPEFTINAKEYVPDESYENGYYIADKNKAYIAYMGEAARVTFLEKGSSEPVVITPDEFIEKIAEDEYSGCLYDFFLFGDQILLIIARAY